MLLSALGVLEQLAQISIFKVLLISLSKLALFGLSRC